MKKAVLKRILPIFFAVMLLLGLGIYIPVRTLAAGVSIDPSAGTVYVGDTVTVAVTLYGSEIYAYSGYIDCDGIFSGDTGGFAEGANGEGSVTLYYTFQAVAEGTGSIYVSGCEVSDGSSKESAGDAACTITVIGYDNGGGGTGGNAGGDDYDDNYSYDWGYINDYEVGEGSGNTNLGSLEVKGYTLTDEGNGIFSITVSQSVKTITINATAEDPAAVVEGTGEVELSDGENYFDIIVYAENGLAQGYALKVTRRGDKVVLADLLSEVKETKADHITVSLQDGDKLTKEMLEAVGKWGKDLILNRYDENGKLLYSWTMNGKDIKDAEGFDSFDPKVTFESKAKDKINSLSNYASGKFISFSYSGDLPKKTTFTFASGTDFQKKDVVRLYYYDEKENKLTQVGDEIEVADDTITVELKHCSEYFVTRANLAPKEEVKEETAPKVSTRKDLIMYIVMAVELIVILGLVALLFLKRKKQKTTPQPEKKEKEEHHTEDFFDSFDDYETELK